MLHELNKIGIHYQDYDDYCYFTDPKNDPSLMTQKEYDLYCQRMQYEDEHEAEQYAENAWLRYAENQYDPGFEQWEHSRMYS